MLLIRRRQVDVKQGGWITGHLCSAQIARWVVGREIGKRTDVERGQCISDHQRKIFVTRSHDAAQVSARGASDRLPTGYNDQCEEPAASSEERRVGHAWMAG